MATKRHIGKVTAAATGGSTLGAALAQIIVWVGTQNGADMSDIESALTIVLTAVLGVVGGYLVPSEGEHVA